MALLLLRGHFDSNYNLHDTNVNEEQVTNDHGSYN